MSKIIKRKVGIIIPEDRGALMIFHPPADNDGHPFKLFHYLSLDEIKALDIREDDVISFEAEGLNKYKLLGVDLTARGSELCKCETEVRPVPAKPKELNMHERINLARSAITGLNIRSAKNYLMIPFLPPKKKPKFRLRKGVIPMAVQRTLEVVNPEALRTDYAFRVLARIAVRYAFENHLFDDVVEVDNSEQKTKVLDLRPRSDREKFRQNMGRKSEENSDCLQRRQELLRIQDA